MKIKRFSFLSFEVKGQNFFESVRSQPSRALLGLYLNVSILFCRP